MDVEAFIIATHHRRRALSMAVRIAAGRRARYVLSTVWFAVGDYWRLLLRFARLLPDHLRGCHATEPPRGQNPILAADADVTDQAGLQAERCFARGHRRDARRR